MATETMPRAPSAAVMQATPGAPEPASASTGEGGVILSPQIDAQALIRHGACGRTWTGASRGHCSGCHETFSSGAFDKHQRISGGVVTCSTDGLVASRKPWGTLWSMPGGENRWWDRRAADPDESRETA